MKNSCYLMLAILTYFISSCENEPIAPAKINTDTIEQGTDLFLLVERSTSESVDEALECIYFNYPFAIFIFDEQQELVEPIGINNDEEFSFTLSNIAEGYSLSISYPISGTLSNGELLEINNNDELAILLNTCDKEDRQRRCNNTFVECYWKIAPWNQYTHGFENNKFKVNRDGLLQYHKSDTLYFGSWISSYIGDELHLNFNLVAGPSYVHDFWNADWRVTLLTDNLIEVNNGSPSSRLVKQCELDCTTGILPACEINGRPGEAIFNLTDYAVCQIIVGDIDYSYQYKYHYFETEEDANNNENSIENYTEYLNTANPQTIHVRIVSIGPEQLLLQSSFDIEVIHCD